MTALVLDVPDRERAVARRRRLFRRGTGCVAGLAELGSATLGVAGMTLLVVLLIVPGVVDWIDARTIRPALDRARAAGAPLTTEEIETLYGATSESDAAAKRWQEALDTSGLANYAVAADEEGVPLVDSRRRDDGSNPPIRDERGLLAGEDLRLARQYVADRREAIEMAHAARRESRDATFPIAFELGVAASLPHIDPLRRLATLLRLDLEVRAADGETEAAVEDLLTNLAICDLLGREPFYVSQIVRFHVLESVRKDAEGLLARGDLRDESLRAMEQAFARTDAHAAFRRALDGERWNFVDAFESRLFDVYQGSGVSKPWFVGADIAKGLEWYDAIDQASRSGLRGVPARVQRLAVEIQQIEADPKLAANYPVSLMFFQTVASGTEVYLRAESSVALLRVAIACERYRLAQGEFPTKLGDLVPAFLDSVPVDPYDGLSLRYVVDANGACLYSVGPDLLDGGGGMPPGSAASAFAPSDDVIRLNSPETSP